MVTSGAVPSLGVLPRLCVRTASWDAAEVVVNVLIFLHRLIETIASWSTADLHTAVSFEVHLMYGVKPRVFV